jgi:hypothetical protein
MDVETIELHAGGHPLLTLMVTHLLLIVIQAGSVVYSKLHTPLRRSI